MYNHGLGLEFPIKHAKTLSLPIKLEIYEYAGLGQVRIPSNRDYLPPGKLGYLHSQWHFDDMLHVVESKCPGFSKSVWHNLQVYVSYATSLQEFTDYMAIFTILKGNYKRQRTGVCSSIELPAVSILEQNLWDFSVSVHSIDHPSHIWVDFKPERASCKLHSSFACAKDLVRFIFNKIKYLSDLLDCLYIRRTKTNDNNQVVFWC